MFRSPSQSRLVSSPTLSRLRRWPARAPRLNRPCDPHQLVRDSDGHDVERSPLQQGVDPVPDSTRSSFGDANERPASVHKLAAHVGIAPLAYAEQTFLPAARMLLRRQAEPCGKMSSRTVSLLVANFSHNRRRNHGANTADLGKPAARFAVAGCILHLPVKLSDTSIRQANVSTSIFRMGLSATSIRSSWSSITTSNNWTPRKTDGA